ncbi:helix-turn-helix transcriptional regulator [Nocardia sp. NPDC052566]|uniref:helix-turn-helix transcriptional regulator n=1 Tax=Nocardia sp. NPDC052566 TaxID=3364330 RepID=UPI0037C9A116
MARSAFAEFLVTRRAELRPADVGLPEGGRRRTPGLRREEVAVLAGLSADYLARLEQGRDRNPSPSVINALAEALRLEGPERHHFGWLALNNCNDSGQCPGSEGAEREIPERVSAVLRALAPTPAFVIGRQLDILGWNAAWEEFATPLGLLDNSTHANLAWFTFAHPSAHRVWRNWSEAADIFVAALRRSTMRWPGDDRIVEFVETLRAHPEFAERWARQRAGAHPNGTLRIDHPAGGTVEVPFETLDSSGDHSIVVWLTDQAQARTPELRLVTDRAVND